MTRVPTRSDLEAVLEPEACLRALREGFRTAAEVSVPGRRVRTDLPFPGTATALLPGLLPGVDAYAVKVNAKFPRARPALRGVICLHAGTDGELLALLDSATVTAWRTGLAAALGTGLLAPAGYEVLRRVFRARHARPPRCRRSPTLRVDSLLRLAAARTEPRSPAPTRHRRSESGRSERHALGVIGAGAQAELTLRGLAVEHGFRDLVVHDTDPGRAAAFAARHGGRVLGSARAVAGAADVVLLATWSRTPLLALADTRAGQHLTSLGTEPGKRELAADLLDAALLVVDDRQLAASAGALAAPGPTRTEADATLSDVLDGTHPGRTSARQRTVYAPVGLPWQDLALAWRAFREAERRDLGTAVDLLG
ncbi:ornithine cyclodeaminase family protein [Streptomyces capoamus]|uniref:ornithine cyclodeaminase family protein n=1 Tax=Streptomyces capoamus TaxID=68183 RepID=UPI0033981B7C